MSNFVYDGTALYDDKTDVRPVTTATQQWSADDANMVKTDLQDLRTAVLANAVNVKQYGAVGDGATDDTAALQAAITATQGRTLYLPKGKYKVTSTLLLTTRSHHLVGDFGNRNSDGGTEISFTGTGPCIQLGVDNGHAWDAGDYDGPQDLILENLWISHASPDTSMASVPGGGSAYKAGAYGIWDWRAGQIVLRSVGIEHFEANFVGVNSDINLFDYVVSLYSKYGVYLGPRSDQNTIRHFYSFLCDRSITIDRAGQTRIEHAQIVGCGTSTTASIEIRQGSSSVWVGGCWFEHLSSAGYQGTDGYAFISAGEVAGYSSGGSISSSGGAPTTTSVEGLVLDAPMIFTSTSGSAAHIKYGVSVNKCHGLVVQNPSTLAGNSLANLDALVGIQAANSPSNSDTQIRVIGVRSDFTFAKLYTNGGAGTPAVLIDGDGASGAVRWSSNRHTFNAIGASAGADSLQLSQEGQAGNVYITAPNYASGQTTRLRLTKSMQIGANASPPTLGTVEVGDRALVTDPSSGGFGEWICTGAGNPGTWCKGGLMLTTTGQFLLSVPAGTTGIDGVNTLTAQTASATSVRGRQAGTYDTTSGTILSVGVVGQSISTRSAGANTLRNIGVQATASGGQDNRALEVVDGDCQMNTTSGTVIFNRTFRATNEVVPAQITSSQDNYSPSGMSDAVVLLINSNGAVNITGFATGASGRWLWVYNTGANTITLKHQTTSTATNQIIGRGGADVALTANTGVQLYYSPSLTKWVVMTDTL